MYVTVAVINYVSAICVVIGRILSSVQCESNKSPLRFSEIFSQSGGNF